MAPLPSRCRQRGRRGRSSARDDHIWIVAIAIALLISAVPAASQYDTIDGHDCFRSLRGITDAMFDLAASYPTLASVAVIGESYLKSVDDNNDDYPLPQNGYDIYAMNITSGNGRRSSAEKGKAMIISGVHPREFAPPELVMRFAETLLEGYDTDSDITWMLEHTEVHLIFHVNPDGRYVTETYQETSWRKNLNPNRSDCDVDEIGTDLKRNYDFQFGNLDGASDDECDETYHGRSPESEPETRAVVEYAKNLFPEGHRKDDPEEAYGESITGVFIDVHSPGGFIFYPWGYKDRTSPDNDTFEPLARKMSSFNGYLLWAGGQPDLQYVTAGDSTDYMYTALGVCALGLELGEDFYEDCSLFEDEVVPLNLPAMLYSVSVATRPYYLVKGPDILSLLVDASQTEIGGGIGVTVVASDSLRLNSLTDEGYPEIFTGDQGVMTVQLYFDVHPDDYAEGDLAWEMESVEIDDERHTFELDIQLMVGIASGRHAFYAQATNGDGFPGPVSSTFVDVVRAETLTPTKEPTISPTRRPTNQPSQSPSKALVTAEPTDAPTLDPSDAPSSSPSASPIASPTKSPSLSPSKIPSTSPTNGPTTSPTSSPTTAEPTSLPTESPTPQPSTQSPTPNSQPPGSGSTPPPTNTLDGVAGAAPSPADSASHAAAQSAGVAITSALLLLLFC